MLEMATHTGAAHLYEQFGLAGRTIAITGAGRGIGRAIAIEAARAGARVAACSRTELDLAALRREIEYLGGQCDSYVVDVSDTDALSTFIEAVVDRSGALDGFVNNAGWNLLKATVDYTRAEVDRILDLNLRAYYWDRRMLLRNDDLGSGPTASYRKRSPGSDRRLIHQVTSEREEQ
jgi:NAD(P)-dependent dehydrogenase (short-subunit alcohol dehydrogenase family)